MTATLSPPGASSRTPGRRPLALLSAGAGVGAAGAALLVCSAVGVVGWFVTDSGVHGDPGDGLRVGALSWLAAHGGHLQVRGAEVTALPLGLTLACAWAVWRFALRLGETAASHGPAADALAEGERDLTVPVAVGAFAAAYVVVAVLVGVLAGTATTQPAIAPLTGWALALSGVVGGAGIAVGSGRAAVWLSLAPVVARATVTAAGATLAAFLGLSSVVLLAALALDLGTAANLLSRLEADTDDAVLVCLLMLLVVPNAVLFAGAYLLGPGFAVGTGTLVSPSLVVVGEVPVFPLLAALPDSGPTPAWTPALVVLPVLCAAGGTAWAQRRQPTTAWDQGALRGLVGGVVAAVVVGVMAAVAGGAVGPGRMADVGPLTGQVLFHGIVSFGIGGLLGGAATTWWQRRHAVQGEPGEASAPD